MKSIAQAFADFRAEAFRFEGLSSYRIPNESALLDEYLSGRLLPDDSSAAWKTKFDPWYSLLRQCRSDNKRIIRVRLITDVPNAYLNWELEWAYPRNVAAGEEVFVLSEAACKSALQSVPSDFWLFDTSYAMDMVYADDGAFIEAVPGRSPLEHYLNIHDKLLQTSISLSRYVSEQRKGRQF